MFGCLGRIVSIVLLDNLFVKSFYKTESNYMYEVRNQLQPFRAAET